jgi:hypothetical protein
VVLIRDHSASGCDLAWSPPTPPRPPRRSSNGCASRWTIETAIEAAKQVFGTGQARNRTARALRRTVPFQLACQSIAITWYATAGHDLPT